jgi:cytochrome c oxidase accessory protein FixG
MAEQAHTPPVVTLATINRDGSRQFVHAAQTRGRFTWMRTVFMLLLMAVYVGLPWIPINGYPAVFFDVANRQFHLFGLTFVAQDLWLGFFIITGLGFGLFYVTALVGRVWCGWACPQTVFLDIIRRFERWCEGDAIQRRRLDAMPWTLGKTIRCGLKQALFILFSLLIAHVFISYFVSLPALYRMMHQAPSENWPVFLLVFAMAAAFWFNFAWFREQFCLVLCPYGRLQSVLMDDDTVVIGYDAKRGEPRGKKGAAGAGDCIDCKRCVQVCPTAIDIRNGLQMECIACSACVDACDEVMEKIGRPRGLIRYDSTHGLAGEPTKYVRPRTILYTVLMLVGAAVMLLSLSTLRPATVSLLRMMGAPYYLDGNTSTIRNQFLVRIWNKRNETQVFRIEIENPPQGLVMSGVEEGVKVGPLGEELRAIIVTLPHDSYRGGFPLNLKVTTADGKLAIAKSIPFLGPSAK